MKRTGPGCRFVLDLRPPGPFIARMRAVVQRVSEASVTVGGDQVAAIGPGLVILLGIEDSDSGADADWLARKILNMRIFEDDEGRMNRSILESGGAAIVVSQFTLHASTRKGNRPSFIRAAKPDHAEPLYEHFCRLCDEVLPTPAGRGRFAAMMHVALVNDGPVTIVMDSRQRE